MLIHQLAYVEQILIQFTMNHAHSLSTLMVVWSLNPKNNLFRPKKDNKEILNPEVPYLNKINVLLYITQCARLEIAFIVYLWVRFNSTPTR